MNKAVVIAPVFDGWFYYRRTVCDAYTQWVEYKRAGPACEVWTTLENRKPTFLECK